MSKTHFICICGSLQLATSLLFLSAHNEFMRIWSSRENKRKSFQCLIYILFYVKSAFMQNGVILWNAFSVINYIWMLNFDATSNHKMKKNRIRKYITVHGLIYFQSVFFCLVLLFFLYSLNEFCFSHHYHDSISDTHE